MEKKEISKQNRKKFLMELIREGEYDSQKALVSAIRKNTGAIVPQATISRDLKELGIMKNDEGYFVLGERFEEQLQQKEFEAFFRKYARGMTDDLQLIGVHVEEGYSQPMAQEIKKNELARGRRYIMYERPCACSYCKGKRR